MEAWFSLIVVEVLLVCQKKTRRRYDLGDAEDKSKVNAQWSCESVVGCDSEAVGPHARMPLAGEGGTALMSARTLPC